MSEFDDFFKNMFSTESQSFETIEIEIGRRGRFFAYRLGYPSGRWHYKIYYKHRSKNRSLTTKNWNNILKVYRKHGSRPMPSKDLRTYRKRKWVVDRLKSNRRRLSRLSPKPDRKARHYRRYGMLRPRPRRRPGPRPMRVRSDSGPESGIDEDEDEEEYEAIEEDELEEEDIDEDIESDDDETFQDI